MSDIFRTAVSVSPGTERGPSINISYSYSRAASILLQQINWDDIDSIKKYYKELPRTLKKIPIHLLGISTEFSNVDRTIKWFSGLNATDQRKQAEYWNALPRLMKDLYKNNINVLIKQQKILKNENQTKKRGRPLGSNIKTGRKKINTVSHSPTAAARQNTQDGNNELNGTSLVPLVVLVEPTITTTSPSELVTSAARSSSSSSSSSIGGGNNSNNSNSSSSNSKSTIGY